MTSNKPLVHAQRDLDAWRSAHHELATLLGAVERGRDHCDAVLVITAIKLTFNITHIAVMPDASAVHITLADGSVRRVRLTQEEIT